MPRRDPAANVRAVRAYHRATALLRDLHREEWEALRTQLLDRQYGEEFEETPEHLPSGPAKGRKPLVALYRKATPEDLVAARGIIAEFAGVRQAAAALRALESNDFIFMRVGATPSVKDLVLDVLAEYRDGIAVADIHEIVEAKGHDVTPAQIRSAIAYLSRRDEVENTGQRSVWRLRKT